MGSFSIWHWLIVLAIVLLLFGGGGKIPKLMKDVGSGIKQFRKGMKDEEQAESHEGAPPRAIEQDRPTVASSSEEHKKAVNG